MPTTAKGSFTVVTKPVADHGDVDGVRLGRLSLEKQFEGDLVGAGQGEMLTAMSAFQGSAGYVAIERFTGTLEGRTGSFVFQHTGRMNRGASELLITVVPDSGTDGLAGIAGTFTIDKVDGRHTYTFDYTLPE